MAGSITPYETSAGKRYRVRYRKPDKSQTDKRGFRTRKDAQLFLATVTVSKATGEYIDPAEAKRTVSGIALQWKTGRLASLKRSSQVAMETSWRIHVEPKWGHRQASAIQASEVQTWVSELSAKRSAQTVRRAVFVLSSIMQIAERDRMIRRNPVVGVVLPAKVKSPHEYLTHKQVAILAAASGTHAPLVNFLAYGGPRWGESVAIRVRSLQFPRHRISITDNAVVVNGNYVIGTPKSGKARMVPMPLFLEPSFKNLIEGKGPSDFVFGEGSAPLPYPHPTSGWFYKAVKAARAVDKTFPTITPHDLRHTAASLAVSAGANVKALQLMLGHASAAMTLDVYADLFDDDLDTVSVALSDARSLALAV